MLITSETNFLYANSRMLTTERDVFNMNYELDACDQNTLPDTFKNSAFTFPLTGLLKLLLGAHICHLTII